METLKKVGRGGLVIGLCGLGLSLWSAFFLLMVFAVEAGFDYSGGWVVSEATYESICIDCGWHGAESEHHFLDGWHVCPKCHQAEFLLSGEEAEDRMEKDTFWYLGNS